MGNPQSDKDQLATILRKLASRFEGTRDLIRELDRDSSRGVQMLIDKKAEINLCNICKE